MLLSSSVRCLRPLRRWQALLQHVGCRRGAVQHLQLCNVHISPDCLKQHRISPVVSPKHHSTIAASAVASEAPAQGSGVAPPSDMAVAAGLLPEELDALAQVLSSMGFNVPVLEADSTSLAQPVAQLPLLLSQEQDHAASSPSPRSLGRVIYLMGKCQQCGSFLNDALVDLGLMPAIVGAQQSSHAGRPLHEVLQQLRAAHSAYHQLYLPCQTSSEVQVPAEASVALNVVLDQGYVAHSEGGDRMDAGHLVVLDGLCSEGERQELLEWLTAPGWDHSGPPPGDKWELACVDRPGEQPTWGLRPEMLTALQRSPPSPMVALQSRLASLYPEWDICHMPAAALGQEYDPDDEEDGPLSSFVGNAVMYGDSCQWHADADPASLPPQSPWVQQHGYYYNREPGKPYFVTGLIYLNDAWAEDLHAETMFLDPGTQAGVFVRPQPGRIVLMDQDMPHRISAPAKGVSSPRYSLVWKLVFYPKQDPDELAASGRDEQAGVKPVFLSRQEWGEPTRFGSAHARKGVPAFKSELE